MSLTPGTKLGHFEVLAALGEGGMGEVYRARDDKLGRDVAIKVIRSDALESKDRRERFVREAKAAAVLNHPNIATVYEIDESDGLTFIAMELIEGDKLSDAISSGRLSTERAIAIAVDVAEGLAAAHAKYIIHRDLKPANIMIVAGEHAKIIDFGLAKLLESGSEAETATKAQAIVGTVAYMSPEQARSEEIDHRSDLFSFGIVLYEMLTGQKPFDGPSAPETLNAIINERTPRLPSGLTSLQPIIDRCLAKNPDERYPGAPDVVSDLRAASPTRTKRRAGAPAAVAALVGAAIAISALVWWTRGTDAPNVRLRIANPTLVTRTVGVEDHPAWSPAGETLAYSASINPNLIRGNWDIWVSQVRGEQPLNRTADNMGDDRYPSWSPDGSQIVFWSDRNDGGVYLMPALTGRARLLSGDVPFITKPQWSKDGAAIAYSENHQGVSVGIELVSVSGDKLRSIKPKHSQGIYDLAWSPDGQYFAFVHARALVAQVTQLVLLRVADGAEIELTDGKTMVWSPTWGPDSGTLAYVSNRGGTRDLWVQRLDDEGEPAAEPEELTTGLEVLSATLNSDGNKIAYSTGRRVSNVWRAPVLDSRVATWSDAEQVTYDQAWIEFLDLSPDGSELAVSSDRAGETDLWILPSAGGEMRTLTTDPTPDWNPGYSPDGKQIVFYAYRSGNRDLWVTPVAGGAARQLTFHEARDSYPTWSPDGTRVAFDSWRDGHSDIWVVTLATGELTQMTSGSPSDRAPTWSPDGRWIVFDRDGNPWRIPSAGGEPESLGTIPVNFARFTPDGGRLLVTRIDDGSGNVWSIDPETKTASPVTDLTGRAGSLGTIALASDGRYVYFTWTVDTADIWVADVVEER